MRIIPTTALALTLCFAATAVAAKSTSQPALSFSLAAPLTITSFGAVADGKTVNTTAIQQAIDTAAGRGGGTVFFPAGQWVTGTLVLKDHVTLHLDNGATLLGSTDLKDYPPHQPAYRSYSDEYVKQALLYAENARHIAVVGRGTIDGRGGAPAFAANAKQERSSYLRRPYLIRFVTCTNVHVEGVTLRDSAMWTQQYLACDNVTITGITVVGFVNLNNDMIDIDGCSNVRMTGCTGDSEDDGITLKSTGPRPCENVTISDCTVGSHCNAIKLGTESTGGFRNITINNVAVRPSPFPVKFYGAVEGTSGISLLMVDGGVLENVNVSNIVIQGTHTPIFLRLGDRARKHVPEAPEPGPGRFRNVTISNIIATNAGKLGCGILGTSRMENITLRDINITFAGGGTVDDAKREFKDQPKAYPDAGHFGVLPAYGFYVWNVDGLTLDNVRLAFATPDDRPVIVADNVSHLAIRGLTAATTDKTPDMIVLKQSGPATISGCMGLQAANIPFVHLMGGYQQINVIGNDLRHSHRPWQIDEPPESARRQQNEFYQAANALPVRRASRETLEEQIEALRDRLHRLENERR